MAMQSIVLVGLGYLLGAIPFGLLIGMANGIDVRAGGSGNIGSTNVGRLLGRKWGYLCFLLDVGKGLAPVLYAGSYLRRAADEMGPTEMMIWLAVGAATILGHMFSVYMGFKGGKGVATSLGVVLGIWPFFTLTGVVVLAVWVAVWGFWGYVSLASIAAAVSFPVMFVVLVWRIDHKSWDLSNLWPLLVFAGLMAALVIVRHRSNIVRLWTGTENRGTGFRKRRDDS